MTQPVVLPDIATLRAVANGKPLNVDSAGASCVVGGRLYLVLHP